MENAGHECNSTMTINHHAEDFAHSDAKSITYILKNDQEICLSQFKKKGHDIPQIVSILERLKLFNFKLYETQLMISLWTLCLNSEDPNHHQLWHYISHGMRYCTPLERLCDVKNIGAIYQRQSMAVLRKSYL